MAQVTVRKTFKVDGVLTNMTSVSIGGVAVTPTSVGVYERTITGLTEGSSYSYTLIWVYADETYTETEAVPVPVDSDPLVCGGTAVAAADILARVKTETGRSNLVAADISDYLISVLVDLSSRYPFLRTHSGGTMSGDEIALPDNYVGGEQLVINDVPFDPITFREYLDDTMDGFALRSKTLYVRGYMDGQAYTLYYGVLHPASLDAIYFGDKFLETIVDGVVSKVYRGKKQYDDAREWLQYYETEIQKRINEMPNEKHVGKIRST